MFVTRRQNARQYWCSADLRHANIAIDMMSDEYRKTSIANNGMQFDFVVEDACGFMVIYKFSETICSKCFL